MSGRITFCACASVQSFLRKFKSTEILAPAFLAASIDSRVHCGRFLAERRGDARDVKPVGALKHLRPVHRSRLELADRRARAIVNDVGGALTRAGFDEVDADAVAAAQDEIGFNPFGAQRPHGGLADIVFRQTW